MPRYIVTGQRIQEISVEVEADDEQDAIDIADMMPTTAMDVWDSTQLWQGVEIIHSDGW